LTRRWCQEHYWNIPKWGLQSLRPFLRSFSCGKGCTYQKQYFKYGEETEIFVWGSWNFSLL